MITVLAESYAAFFSITFTTSYILFHQSIDVYYYSTWGLSLKYSLITASAYRLLKIFRGNINRREEKSVLIFRTKESRTEIDAKYFYRQLILKFSYNSLNLTNLYNLSNKCSMKSVGSFVERQCQCQLCKTFFSKPQDSHLESRPTTYFKVALQSRDICILSLEKLLKI